MDLTGKTAQALARRSSRRQFFKFLAAGSLGTGLFLTRTNVSLGSVSGGCVGCGGGPCNPCWSPAIRCNDLVPSYPCKTCVLKVSIRPVAEIAMSTRSGTMSEPNCCRARAPASLERRRKAMEAPTITITADTLSRLNIT